MEMLGMIEPNGLAMVAVCEGNVQKLQKQLDRGISNWGNLGH